MERKIVEDNGTLFITLTPLAGELEKGGAGSGNFGHGGRAGVRGGSSGGGGRMAGGGGGRTVVTQIKLNQASEAIDLANDYLENGEISEGVDQANAAYEAMDELLDEVDVSEELENKAEALRDVFERSMEEAEQYGRSGDIKRSGEHLDSAIGSLTDMYDILEEHGE